MEKIKIGISGISGKMGKIITSLIQEDSNSDFLLVGGICNNSTHPLKTTIKDLFKNSDVIIDFSNHSTLNTLLEEALLNKKPLVIGTTGFSEDQFLKIKDFSKNIPILYSANFSMGVALCKKLIRESLKLFDSQSDIGIIETHHNKKKDAPSGTAKLFAEEIKKTINRDIPISSIRAGATIGEHDIYFSSEEEKVTISHEAFSRKVFARGALNGAKFLITKESGSLYSLDDLC